MPPAPPQRRRTKLERARCPPLTIRCAFGRLAKRRIRSLVGRNHRLVALTHREQLVLGHDVLAAMLHVVLVDAREYDGIHRAGLLAEAAIDALEQVDVVAAGATRAVRG